MIRGKHTRRAALFAAVAIAAMFVVGTGAALADKPDYPYGAGGEAPFLCPSVGAGVLHHNPEAGQIAGDRYTFLPGLNQAGAHANENALNPKGPGDSPAPGDGNSDWSPIWSYH